MKKVFMLLSLSITATAVMPSVGSAKLVLDLPPILAGKTSSSNTCTDDASCAGSSYGSYCCDGKCQTAECPLPNTCTDDASCTGSSYGSYCCDGKCQTAECPLPNTCTDDASCAGSSYGSYCCDGKCQTAECPLPNTCTDDASCAGSSYGSYCCDGKCQTAECNAVPTTDLNDTGITSRVGTSGQEDADSGRDTTANNNADGHAGFSFTKLDSNCVALTDQTKTYVQQPWSYVKDNVTGLIWEIKNDPPERPWYDENSATNGGNAGTENGGSNTQKYVEAANTAQWCGTTNWRMPTAKELFGLVNSSKKDMAVDQNYFPNINSTNGFFWSATPYAADATKAWAVRFTTGQTSRLYPKSATTISVMLVRNAE